MIDFETELLKSHPEWCRVLAVYGELAAAEDSVSAHAVPDNAGDTDAPGQDQKKKDQKWVGRVAEISGIEGETLSQIHGKLIALGMLRFQIESRTAGVTYQLTPHGKKTLARLEGDLSELDPDSEDDDVLAQAG